MLINHQRLMVQKASDVPDTKMREMEESEEDMLEVEMSNAEISKTEMLVNRDVKDRHPTDARDVKYTGVRDTYTYSFQIQTDFI